MLRLFLVVVVTLAYYLALAIGLYVACMSLDIISLLRSLLLLIVTNNLYTVVIRELP